MKIRSMGEVGEAEFHRFWIKEDILEWEEYLKHNEGLIANPDYNGDHAYWNIQKAKQRINELNKQLKKIKE